MHHRWWTSLGYSMAGKKGQKKRFWSDDEKHLICGQARVAGISVAQVARRYSMNANLIHKWLRDPRFAADVSDDALEVDEAPGFLPLEIEGVVSLLGRPQNSVSAAVVPGTPVFQTEPIGVGSVVHLFKAVVALVVTPIDEDRSMIDTRAILAPSFKSHMGFGQSTLRKGASKSAP